MQVGKWGNSLAVRLPAAVVEALDLKEGDQIEIRPGDRIAQLVITRVARPEFVVVTAFSGVGGRQEAGFPDRCWTNTLLYIYVRVNTSARR